MIIIIPKFSQVPLSSTDRFFLWVILYLAPAQLDTILRRPDIVYKYHLTNVAPLLSPH